MRGSQRQNHASSSVLGPSSGTSSPSSIGAPSPARVTLPSDLSGSLKYLDDAQLNRLLEAVTVEINRSEKEVFSSLFWSRLSARPSGRRSGPRLLRSRMSRDSTSWTSVDVSERQMGLRRLGTESSPDSPLEGNGFDRPLPGQSGEPTHAQNVRFRDALAPPSRGTSGPPPPSPPPDPEDPGPAFAR